MRNEILINGINESVLKCMNGLDFEDFCVQYYRLIYPDYIISKTEINDFGADIVAIMDHGRKLIAQCKIKEKDDDVIGVSAIQEIIAARDYYNASYMNVICNTTFTDQAKQLARENMITLINLADILNDIIVTHLEISDIPYLYKTITKFLQNPDNILMSSLLDNPVEIFSVSDDEIAKRLSLILNKKNIAIDDDLKNGIRHIIFLCLVNVK